LGGVLVVDDAAEIRAMLRVALAAYAGPEEVWEAGSGGEALELAEQRRPDAIVLDLAMPRRSGLDVLPELRNRLPGARIVVYTAYSDQERRAREAGADAYFVKGEPLRNLVDSIRREAV
jgi:CheY-like chemotaxis protein